MSTATALAPGRYSWRKLSALKWSDSWMERLAFLGPQRVMIIELAGARTARVEAHGLTKKEGDGLVKQFGGKLTEAKWLTVVDPPERAPIRVRGRLLVFSTAREMETHRTGEAKIPAVIIPAGMAFGTGEHATTATCLRLLVDVAREQKSAPWEMLDLGTGSGILAIAARKLGARKVLAGDFDPHSVRTAKENVQANDADKVSVKRLDVLKWEPERTWEVVCANLFSGLLIQAAPKLAAATAFGGRLVFSGILREQEREVTDALGSAGFRIQRVIRKGKWCSGLASR